MLREGLGWGSMPAHLVENDPALGRLKIIRPADFENRIAKLAMGGAYLADRQLGPAGHWMVGHLSNSREVASRFVTAS